VSTQTVDPDFEALLAYLNSSRGFDFRAYKRSTLTRRVERRMQMLGIERYLDYVDHLEVHPEEFGFLFDMVLINVTEFFRDPQSWERLAEDVLPQILSNAGDRPIRAWSAGCASGEEAYTLAIVLAEALGTKDFQERVKIYATDVDEDSLGTARLGNYGEKDLALLTPEIRERYFEPVNGSPVFSFRKDLRRSVIFGRHDLTNDAPISRLDLLICRNVLMYFNAEAQARVLTRFHFGLAERGFLFLGKAETLLTQSQAFAPVDLKHRIFAKVSGRVRVPPPEGPAALAAGETGDRALQEAAFGVGPVAQIVVDVHGTLASANVKARSTFGVGLSDLGRPIQDLEISYRPVELRSLIERARRDRAVVEVEDVLWTDPSDGAVLTLAVQVMPLLGQDGTVIGTSVAIRDVTEFARLEDQLQTSNRQLETAYEELQSTNEELETTNEELQSTIEELETTNEELQSTNEELETMNEELQSTNEEMHTINEELRERSEELGDVNSYLESILTSFRSGVVVVDRELLVRVWNHWAEDLWGLRSDEVEGKNFLNLDIGLPVSQLREAVRNILAGGAVDGEVQLEAINRRGKSIVCRVRTTPLAADGEVRGAILLMEDAGV